MAQPVVTGSLVQTWSQPDVSEGFVEEPGFSRAVAVENNAAAFSPCLLGRPLSREHEKTIH
jgi:hypothetical protein